MLLEPSSSLKPETVLDPRIDRRKQDRYTNWNMLSIGIAFAVLSCLVCVTNIVNYTVRMVKKRTFFLLAAPVLLIRMKREADRQQDRP